MNFDQNMVMGIFIFCVIFSGLFGIITQKNLIKKLLMLGVMNTGVIGFFIFSVMGDSAIPPIITEENMLNAALNLSDPLPQALVITSVVIGFATQSLSLVFVMLISKRFHSIDEDKVEILVERERENVD